jgi:hypothetical protein
MLGRRSLRRNLFALLAASVVAATSLGCQIRIGQPDAESAASAGDDPCSRAPYSSSPDCRQDKAAREDWAQKQKEFDTAFAAEIAEFHAMEADLKNVDGANEALVTKADDLRARFLGRCIAESGWSTTACWNGTFARDITTALVKIRAQLGDLAGAAAEAYTIGKKPDLRPTDMKIWKIQGLYCGRDMFAGHRCSMPPEDTEARELYDRLNSYPRHPGEVQWRGGTDIQGVTRTRAAAVFTFKSVAATSSSAQSCGDPEWQKNSAGNDVLVRPCETDHFVSDAEYYAPALVPLAEIGDFKVSAKTGALVVYAKKGKHAGHAVETWIDTGRVDDRKWPVIEYVLFRGTPVREAKPGYP